MTKLRLYNGQVTKKAFAADIPALQALLAKSALYTWGKSVRYDVANRSCDVGYEDGLGTFIHKFSLYLSKEGWHVFYAHRATCYPLATHLRTLENAVSEMEGHSIK